MSRSTMIAVAAAAVSSAAMAQVGADPVENKIPAAHQHAEPGPPSTTEVPPATDDAAPSDRVDTPATVTPAPGDPTATSAAPPK